MGNVLTFKDEKSEVLVPFLSFYKHVYFIHNFFALY